MAKKNISLGRLADLSTLTKLVKKADYLIVGQESGLTYICNGHWLVRLRLAPGSPVHGEIYKRLAAFPEEGNALQSRVSGAIPYNLDSLKKFFSGTFYATCYDTRLTYHADRVDLHVFDCVDEGTHTYITLGEPYFAMIHEYARAAAQKSAKSASILFTANSDEAALLMPIYHDAIPYMVTF